MERETLGRFLKSRRDRVTPQRAGLHAFGTPRRVPGLRREELAQLAGVSVGYYTRLEQDQAGTPSSQVLDSIARVLTLDTAERAYLHNLAAHPGGTTRVLPDAERPHPRVLALLDQLDAHTPAVVLGRRNDVLAWNAAGHALLAPHVAADAPSDPAARPSASRLFFLDPYARTLHRNWDEQARTEVAYLRLVSGRHPEDALLSALIDDLVTGSPEFAMLWAGCQVADCTTGTKRLHHPMVGDLDVDYQIWIQPDTPDNRLEIYTATPGNPSADALALLAAAAAETDEAAASAHAEAAASYPISTGSGLRPGSAAPDPGRSGSRPERCSRSRTAGSPIRR